MDATLNRSTVNFSGKFQVYKGYFTIGVDNIFDEKVQVSGDLTTTAGNRYVYYDLGRIVKGGYEIAF